MRGSMGLAVFSAALLIGQAAAFAGDAAKGKQAFMKYGCWQCHGTLGQGSPITGPKLAPDPIAYEAMAGFIRSSSRRMPPYREAVLPNEDLQDIHAYLSSIPKGADPKTIPLLSE